MQDGRRFTRLGQRVRQRPSALLRRRLVVEFLEDRRLLAADRDIAAPGGLSVDPSQHRASSLIVQFRDGASSAGSLAAYSFGATLSAPWAVAPGLREVELNPGADVDAARAAYAADPNVE